MKRHLIYAIVFAAMGLVLPGLSSAEGFYFGEETKGVTFTQGESDLTIRVRFQPRFDYGDIIESKDGTTYESEGDLYLRRVRLEFAGHIVSKVVRYHLTLDGDRWDQAGGSNKVSVKYVFVTWEPDPAYSFFVGKLKLPFSRDMLTRDSTSLMVDTTASTDDAKNIFGQSNGYFQPKIALFGRLMDGSIAYEVALADGWQNGETIQTGTGRTVFKAPPLFAARVELSPPGWVEARKIGSHLGKGQHLVVGLSYARQGSIEYQENGYEEDRSLWGMDVSGHFNAVTAQAEYIAWEIDSSDPAIGETKPEGWYVQAGYFIDGLNLEPTMRYEVYDEDTNTDDSKEKSTTLGVNWYGKGHSLKVQANWVHTSFDDNASGKLTDDDSKDVLQVQAQVFF
ncbi:MAG TPA: porin [Thermodesulfobacteriota bacterium]